MGQGGLMMKRLQRKQGFTLIEVLIAMAIISLIAVVSLPMFTMGMKSVESSEGNSEDLFAIQSKIENSQIDPGQGSDMTLSFEFSGYPVDIPVKLYDVRLSPEDHVSITYFESVK